MPGRPSARRYAQAAFELALEHDAIDQWSADLDALVEALKSEDFAALLEAPQAPAPIKRQGVETVLGDVSQRARNLLLLLVEHRQPRIVDRVRDAYRTLVDEHRGIARAEVTTAVPLEDDQRDRVRELLSARVGKRVIMAERVDPAIVGGIIARVGDRLIDGSARTRLATLRDYLARPPVAAAESPGE